MRNRTKVITATAILVLLVAAASFRIYTISELNGGCVLWNGRDAYFFIKVDDRGYNATHLKYPWILFKRHVIGGFAAEFPNDERGSLIVIHVTSVRIERHIRGLDRTEPGSNGSDPYRFTPLEGHIYASCPWLIGHFMQDGHLVGKDMDDGLCRWADDRFEKATEEDKRRLGDISRLTKADFENDDGGWSRRELGAGPAERKFTIHLGDGFQLSVNNVARGDGGGTISIDLLRPGKASERIGDFDAHDRRVSKAEYLHVFHDHT